MRVKHKPWAKDYILEKKDVFINSYIDKNAFDKLIEGFEEVRIEIGCGKGKFIYENAYNNPKILYIGIERQASVLVSAARKVEEQPINNLKFYYGDIFNLNDNNVLNNKTDFIYLNFSDPWPKKRHIKRRLTYEKFLELYYRLLKKEGVLILKTDNTPFFEYSICSISNHKKWIFEEIYLDLHSHLEVSNITTEYEEKFSQKGFAIKYLKIKK